MPAPEVVAGNTAAEPAVDATSDDELTLLFSAAHADLRFTAESGNWSRYDGKRWLEIPIVAVYDLARDLVRTIAAQSHPRARHGILAARTVNAVAMLARGDARHLMRSPQWDADPWLLNTPHGVIDLRTGALRAAEAADYLTKMTAVGPAGECPGWLNFLDRITGGNHELQKFLQRYAGYSLTGITREHKFIFGHGYGGNGKGRYCYAIAGIMGDYAISAPRTFSCCPVTTAIRPK